jgi:hypothetical protein
MSLKIIGRIINLSFPPPRSRQAKAESDKRRNLSESTITNTCTSFSKNSKGEFEFAVFKRADADFWQGIAGGGEDNETPMKLL